MPSPANTVCFIVSLLPISIPTAGTLPAFLSKLWVNARARAFLAEKKHFFGEPRERDSGGYVPSDDWTCAIEHVEPERAVDTYRYMWKLPLFGQRNTDMVVGEPMACRNSHPGHHLRVIGYDSKHQTQGLNMVGLRGA